ncbi:MAG: molybdenum ABC transporter ATP-binding protein [Alphaproteobacteria bacterium]|nr:molybdenum ABC transporter ATP-binding protein [Alphaproteobacteria bacterium]
MLDDALEIDARLALRDLSLSFRMEWKAEGCLGVVGASGAGKTTLLRLIAGLERPDDGRIRFGDEIWCSGPDGVFAPPHRRRVGFVFQDARLFPHLSVDGNLRYAARRAGVGPDKMMEAVDAFGLEPLLDRRPATLSGGERQRAAIARAILSAPRLLLLDEPLSALDAGRRREILPYLDALPRRFGVPIILVSHNSAEIARLADNTAILVDGRIEGPGQTAAQLNAYHAATSGREAFSVIACRVERRNDEMSLTHVRFGEYMISLPAIGQHPGDAINVRIDARDVALSLVPPDKLSIRNVLPGTIVSIENDPAGPWATATLDCNGAMLRAIVTRAAVADLGLRPGMGACALIKSATFES